MNGNLLKSHVSENCVNESALTMELVYYVSKKLHNWKASLCLHSSMRISNYERADDDALLKKKIQTTY